MLMELACKNGTDIIRYADNIANTTNLIFIFFTSRNIKYGYRGKDRVYTKTTNRGGNN